MTFKDVISGFPSSDHKAVRCHLYCNLDFSVNFVQFFLLCFRQLSKGIWYAMKRWKYQCGPSTLCTHCISSVSKINKCFLSWLEQKLQLTEIKFSYSNQLELLVEQLAWRTCLLPWFWKVLDASYFCVFCYSSLFLTAYTWKLQLFNKSFVSIFFGFYFWKLKLTSTRSKQCFLDDFTLSTKEIEINGLQ